MERSLDAEEWITKARSEKSALSLFLDSFETFTKDRARNLNGKCLNPHKNSIPQSYLQFRSQIQLHIREIDDEILEKESEIDNCWHRIKDKRLASESDPLRKTQKLIDDTNDGISRAELEKSRVHNFVNSFQTFSLDRAGQLTTRRLEGYNVFIPQALQDFESQMENYVKDIDVYIQDRERERDALFSNLRHQAYHSSLVHRLPFDVLGLILAACVRITDARDNTALRVASVSATWRNVALRTPLVWNKVVLEVNSRRACNGQYALADIDLARKRIARSGVTPLYLSVHWYLSSSAEGLGLEWTELICSLAPRLVEFEFSRSTYNWHTVFAAQDARLIFQQPMPKLKVLSFFPGWNKATAPKGSLQGVSQLHTATVGYPLGTVSEDLKALYTLHIRSNCHLLDFCDGWFSGTVARSLRVLSLNSEYSGGQGVSTLPPAPFVLPCLEDLRVLSAHYCEQLLDILSLPALQILRIDAMYRNLRPLSAFFESAAPQPTAPKFPHLHSFWLHSTYYEKGESFDNTLKQFLQAHQNLTSLSLKQVPAKKTMAALARFPKTRGLIPLCPRIERLEVDGFERGRIRHRSSLADDKPIRGGLDELLEARVHSAVPPESYTEKGKKFVRLVSLKWNGVERCPASAETEATKLA